MRISRIRWEVFARDGYRCMECRKEPPYVALVMDHILPQSLGGPTLPFNLQTLCEDCNTRKSDKLIFEDFPVYGDSVDRREWFLKKFGEYAELREAEIAILTDRYLIGA